MSEKRPEILIGAHVSISGEISKAVERAVALGCNTFQIFPSSPRMWKMKDLGDEDVATFKKELEASGIKKFYVHMPYLPNIASPEPASWEKSVESLVTGLQRAARLGADGMVTHMGSHKGAGLKGGIERAARAIGVALAENGAGSPPILMEIAAGKSSQVGTNFDELNRVWERVDDAFKAKVGICYDTCHAFAMGYDISEGQDGFDRALAEMDEGIGRDALKLVHLNDSKTPLDGKADRHANIGEGEIGLKGIEAFVNHPFIVERNIPLVLETPGGPERWPEEIELVRI
ncbi:MAG: deoxyribonuclease IV [bacterium]|nr:deoxyribonuclease IV [bacterium]